MSNIYIQEPPTDGKILLETTVGDIEIELWSKEAPKAARNFVQLCMEGYYKKTKFHRVVKNFIAQGGDPTGTGHGGESIYGLYFKDEFHQRLRFVRRGLVAMANNDEPNTNGSQFFFTLGQTPELQNKHTIFGKISGNTIFNVMRLQEGIIGEDDRPEHPHKIRSTKVITNPFPDIVPRVSDHKKEKLDDESTNIKKSKMKAHKDFKLLSFGDEAEEEDEDLQETLKKESTTSNKTGKSSHDLLNDPKLSKEAGISNKKVSDEKEEEEDDDIQLPERVTGDDNDSISESKLETIRNKLKSKSIKKTKVIVDENYVYNEKEYEDEEEKAKRLKREEIKKEIKKIKKDLKGPEVKEIVEEKSNKRKLTEEEMNNDILIDFHETKEKFAEKTKLPKTKSAAREDMTMKLLEKFKQKLREVPKEDDLEKTDDKKINDSDEDDPNWLGHKLSFKTDDPVLAKDASSKDDEWFDIYDPRNPINKRRRGEASHTSKKQRR